MISIRPHNYCKTQGFHNATITPDGHVTQNKQNYTKTQKQFRQFLRENQSILIKVFRLTQNQGFTSYASRPMNPVKQFVKGTSNRWTDDEQDYAYFYKQNVSFKQKRMFVPGHSRSAWTTRRNPSQTVISKDWQTRWSVMSCSRTTGDLRHVILVRLIDLVA